MERLTERNPGWINDESWLRAREPCEDECDEVYRKLKYYEDLEEDELIQILPCREGSWIYCIDLNPYWGYIYPDRELDFTKNKWVINKDLYFHSRDACRFGKTVFVKLEEAKEKLEEMNLENNVDSTNEREK